MSGKEWIDDNIYGVPNVYNKQLKIDITIDTVSLIRADIPQIASNTYNRSVVDENCNIYAIPTNANKSTKFNTTT